MARVTEDIQRTEAAISVHSVAGQSGSSIDVDLPTLEGVSKILDSGESRTAGREVRECNTITVTPKGWRRDRNAKEKQKTPGPHVLKDITREETAKTSGAERRGGCDEADEGTSIKATGDQDTPLVASQRQHKQGCLFTQCLRCPQMLLLTFASGVLPNLPVRPDNECANGIVVTLCSSCTNDSRRGKHQATDCANHYKKARISAAFLAGSKVSQAAAETVGEQVPFLTVNGSPMFVLCDFIRRLVTIHDMIESVVESENEARCITAPLRGGFL